MRKEYIHSFIIFKDERKIKMNNTKIIMLKLSELEAHPDNPRKNIGDVSELADSIRESGIMQNLTVVPFEGKYRVVIGHRRMAAAKMAGLTEVPCAIAVMDYKTQIATMLTENMNRSDLTVVEQAEGIQMMFDFGESIEEISKKTGFSQSTVRKRLTVAGLPHDETIAAEERGGTLEDFIKVSKIEDKKEREKLLKSIGTSNFAWNLQSAEREQKINKKKPVIEKWCKKQGFEKLKETQRYSSAYEVITDKNMISDEVDPEKPLISEEKIKKYDKIFYLFYYNNVVLMAKAKKSKKVETVSAKEKEIKRREKALKEKFGQAYELRRAFVDNFNESKKYKEEILGAFLKITCYDMISYGSTDRNFLREKCGVTGYMKTAEYLKKVDTFLLQKNAVFQMTYAAFYDERTVNCYTYSLKYEKNEMLDQLYAFLILCGYQMSDEERKLINGTHELYMKEEEE